MVDTRDMVVVHTALLRELRLAPGLVEQVTPGDAARIAVVRGHLDFVLDLLAHHHQGEDRLLWPKLLARVPAGLAGLVAAVQAQHTGIEDLMLTVRPALDRWTSAAGRSGGDLAALLRRLHALVEEHLHFEELDILPLAAMHLTEAEWRQVGEAGVASIGRSKLPMVFGMLMYEGDPVVLRTMLSSAPLLPRLLVPRIAPRAYARYARRIHGGPRP